MLPHQVKTHGNGRLDCEWGRPEDIPDQNAYLTNYSVVTRLVCTTVFLFVR